MAEPLCFVHDTRRQKASPLASSIQERGFAVVQMPNGLAGPLCESAEKAALFFDNNLAKQQLKTLNDAVRRYSGSGNSSVWDEISEVGDTQEVVRVVSGGFMSRQSEMMDSVLPLTEIDDTVKGDWGKLREKDPTSLAGLAHRMLLELISEEGDENREVVERELRKKALDSDGNCACNLAFCRTLPSNEDQSKPAIEPGFLMLLYFEQPGLQVRSNCIVEGQEWVDVEAGPNFCVVLAGHLLSQITSNAFPLAAFRFVPKGRTQHLATLFSIRPPPRSKILAHTVFNDDDAKAPEREEDAIAAHLAAYERIGTCFDADSIMDEVEAWALTKHYVHAQDQEDARSSTQSVMLRAEAERKHARWVALMMGLHARLGAHLPLHADLWKQICVRAQGVHFALRQRPPHGADAAAVQHHDHLHQAYSALLSAPLSVFLPDGPDRQRIEARVGGSVVGHRWTLARCGVKEGTTVALADVAADDSRIDLAVRYPTASDPSNPRPGGNTWRFAVKKSTPMRKVRWAFCEKLGVGQDADRVELWREECRLCDDDTATSLALRDGAVIVAKLLPESEEELACASFSWGSRSSWTRKRIEKVLR